ncbi:MAG: hypothetical protein BWK80_13455 [Desulfobacteraceae bacterium IS3]|nr:MAG: hypothetical protein BWK80_13455 [Desulfobacteraceae bacterium IS3]
MKLRIQGYQYVDSFRGLIFCKVGGIRKGYLQTFLRKSRIPENKGGNGKTTSENDLFICEAPFFLMFPASMEDERD